MLNFNSVDLKIQFMDVGRKSNPSPNRAILRCGLLVPDPCANITEEYFFHNRSIKIKDQKVLDLFKLPPILCLLLNLAST